jgi:bifunctional UDP-N-acetylglucosamine pyrophosphorylase/glucosamine-1-phosphate N-acetyltransferase
LGNYAEVNRSRLGREVKMHHFSYLGDATVGDGANIAAGVITCNYDGVNKNPTVIGAGAFVGCDTMLVAPVTMGDGSQTGAGTVLNRDLAPGERAVGVPARILPAKPEGS